MKRMLAVGRYRNRQWKMHTSLARWLGTAAPAAKTEGTK